MTSPLVETPIIVATPMILATGAKEPVLMNLVQRFQQADWGAVPAEDLRVNDWAVEHGGQILGVYFVGPHRIWIMKDVAGVTTIMLPEEY